MRIVPCTLVILCVLAGSSGCQLFNRKSNDADTPFVGSRSNEQPKITATNDPLIGTASAGADLDGLLAGRVIDGTGRPADAQIRWACLDESKEADAPLEVAVNSQGYFMIQGLMAGKHYKLVTRAKSGEKDLEVITLTKVPNVHLVIQVSEKFAVPSGSTKGKGLAPKKKSGGAPSELPASAQIPIPLPGWPQPEIITSPPVSGAWDKTRIAQDGNEFVIRPPTVKTPGPAGGSDGWKLPGEEASMQAVPIVPSPYSITLGPVPVPSSVKFGNRLENFALHDVNLKPWELKSKRRGNIVLLDFWKTNCPPCLETIPHLRILQDKYRAKGLEVVSIAYEDGGSIQEQGQRVAASAGLRHANYQLLLGGGTDCPLRRDLQVRAYPTLVLLDQSGTILWQHTGGLDAPTLQELEFRIEQRFGREPY